MKQGFLTGFVILTSLTLSACAIPLAGNVLLMSLSSELKPGTSVGPVTGQDCATTVFGYGRSRYGLTVQAALERVQTAKQIRYFNNFSLDRTSTTIVVYNRSCLIVRGDGFK
ncbi:MAG: hypothetical protein NTX25_08570 [Proteobacteria bacterium]|nr:hypothetical protein [Pseudomonadota bacterium]